MLASPIRGEMKGRIRETLRAKVEARLEWGGRTLFAGVGEWAGLEVVHLQLLQQGDLRR